MLKFTLLLNLPSLSAAADFDLVKVCGSVDPPRSLFEVRGEVGIILTIWAMGGFFTHGCLVPMDMAYVIA